MEKLLTISDVNALLGMKDTKGRYLKRLKEQNVLPGIYIGHKLLFKESDVEEFIENEFKKQN